MKHIFVKCFRCCLSLITSIFDNTILVEIFMCTVKRLVPAEDVPFFYAHSHYMVSQNEHGNILAQFCIIGLHQCVK